MSDKRENCQYWEKCYRKDKAHLLTYQHPAENKKAAEPVTKTADEVKPAMRKEKTLELTEEEIMSPPAKPGMRKRKTHEISVENGDSTEPVAKKAKKEQPMVVDEETEPVKKEETKPVKKAPPTRAASKTTPSTSTATTAGAVRARCKYWDKCFRKDKGHKTLYVHPGDPDEKQSVKEGVAGRTRTSARPKPLHRMDSVDAVVYGGYTLKRTGSNYECNCSSFTGEKNFGKALNMKTCTHLIQYLGEDYERSRCELPAKGKKETKPPQHVHISVLLAHKYKDGDTNPKGWWMSEKLDGVRAYWNGRCFYSRLGNAFYAPAWFTKDLPRDMHLDGELFGGRKKFQSTVSIVKTPEHPKWNTIKFCVFDAPHLEKEPFEKRMKAITDQFEKVKPEYAKFVEHERCTGKDHVDKELKRIIDLGGEGLMIRQPGSKYERTRSHTLLKIKKFHDAEAIVIGFEPSKSNPGLTGALRVQMANGKQFKVGSGLTNKDRKNPPKKGTIITYKFQEYSNSGTPRFPTYVGVRIDMTEPKDAEGVVTEGKDDE